MANRNHLPQLDGGTFLADGFEVTEQLQALMSRAKFVLMSGHTDHALLQSRALQTCPTFMQKPFTPAEMALKLRSVLDG